MRTVELTKDSASNRSYGSILLEEIAPGDNPRKSQDKAADAELLASVKQHGVIAPVLVKRTADGPTPFVLVYGSRRVAAAKGAKLTKIPALIADDLTPGELEEIQFTENEHREPLPPLEQASVIAAMQDRGETIAGIATKLGKSATWVARIGSLVRLVAPGQKLLREGVITAEHALLLARRSPLVQAQLLKEGVRTEYGSKKVLGFVGIADLRRFLERQDLDLTKAPFDVNDAALVPAAGSCTVCPKRSGNSPELFDDIKSKSVCTDPPCFGQKVQAMLTAKEKQLEAELGPGKKPVLLSEEYDYSGQKKKEGPLTRDRWQPVAKTAKCKTVETGLIVVTQRPYAETLGAVQLICRDAKCASHRKNQGRAETVRRALTPQEKAARAKVKLDGAVLQEVWRQTTEAATALTDEDLRRIAVGYFGDVWHEFQKAILARFGWLPEKGERISDRLSFGSIVAARIAKASKREVVQFLVALTTVKDSRRDPQSRSGLGETLATVAKERKVDPKQVRKALEAKAAAKIPQRPKGGAAAAKAIRRVVRATKKRAGKKKAA